MLVCKSCNNQKEDSEFVKIRNKIYNECKKCRNIYINTYKRDIHSGKRQKLDNNIKNGMKKCLTCENNKEISEFPKRNDTEQGYRNECKNCKKNKMNNYYQNTYNEVTRKRKKTDPKFKLIANHRLYLYKCVKKNKLIKKK